MYLFKMSKSLLTFNPQICVCQRGKKVLARNFIQPHNEFKDVVMPPLEERQLPIVDPVPTMPNGVSVRKLPKKLEEMRGPEVIKNRFIYKQFGIIALCGGQFKPEHFNSIRTTINRSMDVTRTFAVWRIDPPWKPLTKKSSGRKLGGGKGSIYTYCTPVRAGTVILEMGGKVEFCEVFPLLNGVAQFLPVDAIAVEEAFFKQLEEEKKELDKKNLNPLSLKYLIDNNIAGCKSFLNYYDTVWYGKYI